MSVNKVILVGNVGKDPEVRYLENNVAVAKFPLATSDNYKNKNGERVSNTEWHNIVAWRGLAEIAEKYVKKGNQLFIEGKLVSRSWDDKEGNKRYITEVIVSNMQMLDKRNQSSDNNQQQATVEETKTETDDVNTDITAEDDLPF